MAASSSQEYRWLTGYMLTVGVLKGARAPPLAIEPHLKGTPEICEEAHTVAQEDAVSQMFFWEITTTLAMRLNSLGSKSPSTPGLGHPRAGWQP